MSAIQNTIKKFYNLKLTIIDKEDSDHIWLVDADRKLYYAKVFHGKEGFAELDTLISHIVALERVVDLVECVRTTRKDQSAEINANSRIILYKIGEKKLLADSQIAKAKVESLAKMLATMHNSTEKVIGYQKGNDMYILEDGYDALLSEHETMQDFFKKYKTTSRMEKQFDFVFDEHMLHLQHSHLEKMAKQLLNEHNPVLFSGRVTPAHLYYQTGKDEVLLLQDVPLVEGHELFDIAKTVAHFEVLYPRDKAEQLTTDFLEKYRLHRALSNDLDIFIDTLVLHFTMHYFYSILDPEIESREIKSTAVYERLVMRLSRAGFVEWK